MHATVERTVQPTVEPITTTEAKLHCRVTTASEDSLFAILIAAARQEAEAYMARTISLTTWRKVMDGFPDCGEIALPYPKILAVSAFQYRDQTGAWTTVDAALYGTDFDSKPGRIYLKWDQAWPSDLDYTRQGCVRVDYKAGYLDSATEADVRAAIPASIRQWCLVRVATLYENREALVTGTIVAPTPGINGLLDPHRVLNIGM